MKQAKDLGLDSNRAERRESEERSNPSTRPQHFFRVTKLGSSEHEEHKEEEEVEEELVSGRLMKIGGA